MARLIVLAIVSYYLSFIVGPLIIEPVLFLFDVELIPPFLDESVGDYFYRIFLTVLTWVVLAYAHIPFGFIAPRVGRFSDTKPLRYFQTLFYFVACALISASIATALSIILVEGFLANDLTLDEKHTAITSAALLGGLFGGWMLTAYGYQFSKSKAFSRLIRFLDQSRFGYGGSGRFTGLPEEVGAEFNKKSGMIFLGQSLYWPWLKCGLKDERHMLTIAGSRGGKGVSAIIPNLLMWKGSAVVIDPKGTNAAVTQLTRSEDLGQRVYVIDPFEITSLERVSFNPLTQFSADAPDARERILLVADALVMTDGKARDPHWDDISRQVLAGFIAHLMTDPSYENRRILPELRNMLRLSGDARQRLIADMSINHAAGSLAVDVANRIINMGDSTELRSVLSSVEKHTEWLSSPALAQCLSGQNSFKIQDIKDISSTIYLVIPPQYLQTHARFVRLFINLVIRGFVDGGKAKIPTILMMDEFLSLGHMAEVENAMSWTAGYNLFLWPFIQDFGSFKELYGTKVNAFLSNSRAVQVFAVDDEETNRFVSERLGKRPLTSRIAISRANETMQVRETSEVALDISAESGRQYILRSGKPTMLLERVPYYTSKIFGDYGIDPDHPDEPFRWQKMLW